MWKSYIVPGKVSMSLPAMSLGLRFCASRKCGTGGDGRVSTLGPGNIASSLHSGCGLHLECVQDGCIGTCVKLEASKPPEVEIWCV